MRPDPGHRAAWTTRSAPGEAWWLQPEHVLCSRNPGAGVCRALVVLQVRPGGSSWTAFCACGARVPGYPGHSSSSTWSHRGLPRAQLVVAEPGQTSPGARLVVPIKSIGPARSSAGCGGASRHSELELARLALGFSSAATGIRDRQFGPVGWQLAGEQMIYVGSATDRVNAFAAWAGSP